MKSYLKYLHQGLSRRMPEDRISGVARTSGFRNNLKTLKPYFMRHWRKAMMGFVLILLSSACGFLSPLVTRYLVDDIILERQMSLLAGGVILMIACLALEKIAGLLQEFYFARFEQRMSLDIQKSLLEKVLYFQKSFFDKQQTGYLKARISDDIGGMKWFFSGSFVHLASHAIHFVGGICFLFYLQWHLALVIVFMLPVLVWSMRYFSEKIHVLSHHRMEKGADVSGDLQESLSEASLIKAYAVEDRTLARLTEKFKGVLRTSLEQASVNSLATLVIHSMPGIARALTIGAGAYWVIKGQWTLGSLLAFQAYLIFIFGPAKFMATANIQLNKSLASLERIAAMFNIVPENNKKDVQRVDLLDGDIEFDNVSFAYNGSKPVLENISFHVRSGEKVAILGPSGVGKTTLVSLLLRFYQPTSGDIHFDGRTASQYELASLRRRIGYVSQEPRIITGTIMENLCLGDPDADHGLVVQAAKASGINDFVKTLSQGFNAIIGEGGLNLSQGQKQRLSIARALIKNPDIFILDEPTSSVDSITEKSIFDALPDLMRDKTLFVVAHRLSTIQNCDRILILNENRLEVLGTHDELMRSNDYYRAMVTIQNTNKDEIVNLAN